MNDGLTGGTHSFAIPPDLTCITERIGLKILLVYYTGTYNTQFLTDRIAERFAALGCSVCKTEIVRNTPVAVFIGHIRAAQLVGNAPYKIRFLRDVYGVIVPHRIKYLVFAHRALTSALGFLFTASCLG